MFGDQCQQLDLTKNVGVRLERDTIRIPRHPEAGAEGLADEPCTARYVSDNQAEMAGSLKGTLSYQDEET